MIKKSERDSGPPPVLGANLGIPLFQYISALSGIGSCHQYDCLHIRDNRIDISLKALDFIEDVSVSLEEKCAFVKIIGAGDDEKIKNAVYDIGFEVTEIK